MKQTVEIMNEFSQDGWYACIQCFELFEKCFGQIGKIIVSSFNNIEKEKREKKINRSSSDSKIYYSNFQDDSNNDNDSWEILQIRMV